MSKKFFIILIFPLLLSGCLPSPVDNSTPAVSVEPDASVPEEQPVEEPEFLPGEISETGEQENSPIIGELTPDEDSPVFNQENPDGNLVNTRIFNMVVKKFEFVPSVIRVKKDNRIVINITSQDEEHGFVIDEYNISRTIPAGQTVTIEFIADKIGSFDFYSNIYAGAGTSSMRGKLIVE